MTKKQRAGLCGMLYVLGGMLASIMLELYDSSMTVMVLIVVCGIASGISGSMLKGER